MPTRREFRLDSGSDANPNNVFHLILHALPATRPFDNRPAGEAVWQLLVNERERSSINLLAACVMPNHAHIVASARGKGVDSWVRDFKALSTHMTTPILGRRFLWQPRFYDRGLRSELELEVCIEYVLRNPIEACLVAEGEVWPWVGAWLE